MVVKMVNIIRKLVFEKPIYIFLEAEDIFCSEKRSDQLRDIQDTSILFALFGLL